MNFLSVDIGGSKNKFTIFNENMKIYDIFENTGIGSATDSDEDIPAFSDMLYKIKEQYKIFAISVNLGGKNKNQISLMIKNCFKDISYTISRESEGGAALAFGEMTNSQAILFAGTGTIAIAKDCLGNVKISGGWGMNIGDGGSGYAIGLEAIRRSLLALDASGELSPLQREITGLNSPIMPSDDASFICELRDNVRKNIFPLERSHIASFTKTVTKYAEAGEADALSIMHDAGEEMGMLMAKIAAPPMEGMTRLAVAGGLVNCKKFWQESFEKTVKENSSISEFVYDADGVTKGTMQMAINLKK